MSRYILKVTKEDDEGNIEGEAALGMTPDVLAKMRLNASLLGGYVSAAVDEINAHVKG
jgi:hypothetical protein